VPTRVTNATIAPGFALHESSIPSSTKRGRASRARQPYRFFLTPSVQPWNLLQPVLQPGWYTLVRNGHKIRSCTPKTPKQAQFPDAPVRARTYASKLVMSRGKRFESARRLSLIGIDKPNTL
jgi:hypothetical protein